MLAYSLVAPPAPLTGYLRRLLQRSSTTHRDQRPLQVHSFGVALETRYIFRAITLDQ